MIEPYEARTKSEIDYFDYEDDQNVSEETITIWDPVKVKSTIEISYLLENFEYVLRVSTENGKPDIVPGEYFGEYIRQNKSGIFNSALKAYRFGDAGDIQEFLEDILWQNLFSKLNQ